MWLDNWHPCGPLLEKYGFRIIYDSQSRIDAKLVSVLRNGDWNWTPAWSKELVDIQSRLSEVHLGVCDKPVWTIARKGVYVSADTWDFLRKKRLVVEWWSMVWFPYAIPKHASFLICCGWLFRID
jgi:hypothetical protein